jgi:hypothetical protein
MRVFSKRIQHPRFRLRISNVYHESKTDWSDQTPKGQTSVRLITNLKHGVHNVHNVLAKTEEYLHHYSIQKVGLF